MKTNKYMKKWNRKSEEEKNRILQNLEIQSMKSIKNSIRKRENSNKPITNVGMEYKDRYSWKKVK